MVDQASTVSCDINNYMFTFKEYQVELLSVALDKNVICLSDYSSGLFISLMLIRENISYLKRSPQKFIFYIGFNFKKLKQVDLLWSRFLNLNIKVILNIKDYNTDEIKNFEILMSSADILFHMLKMKQISPEMIHLLIIDDCHIAFENCFILQIIENFTVYIHDEHSTQVLILGPTIFDCCLHPKEVEDFFIHLERFFKCQIETSSYLTSALRTSSCKEYIIEYDMSIKKNVRVLDEILKGIAQSALNFLTNHNYNLKETYGDQYLDIISEIPDPVLEPKIILTNFLEILEDLDHAALFYLNEIETLKERTAHDRHFLLLSVVHTVMLQVRFVCQQYIKHANNSTNPLDYVSPKMLKLMEIINNFVPSEKCSYKDQLFSPHKELNQVTELIEICNGTNINNAENTVKQNRFQKFCCTAHLTKKTDQCNNYYNDDLDKKEYSISNSNQSANIKSLSLEDKHSKFENNDKKQADKKFVAYNPDDIHSFCCMIFVNSNIKAHMLYLFFKELQKIDEKYKFIIPQFILKYEKKSSENFDRKHEEILRRFRMKESNLLIMNDILNEVIDFPKCNLIIRFDFPLSFSLHVMCKSQALSDESFYVIMMNISEEKMYLERLSKFLQFKEIFLHRCNFYEPLTDLTQILIQANTLMPAFQPVLNMSSILTMTNAINMINKYCFRLPSDAFTKLIPIWEIRKTNYNNRNLYKCYLRLPINSPLKQPVMGDAFDNVLLAKMSSALKCCILLYACGELDSNLQPVGKENIKWETYGIVDSNESNEDSLIKPGSIKRRQYYDKKISDNLKNCTPVCNVLLLMHKIQLTLNVPIPDLQNIRGRKIYRPENSVENFCILSTKNLPKICPFPIYTRSGEVIVKILLVQNNLILNHNEIEKLRCFHFYLFSEVLRLEKYPMKFDADKSDCNFLIVPTIEDKVTNIESINWPFIEKIINFKANFNSSNYRHRKFNFVSQNFENAVVYPWYRNQDRPQYFYVAEICYNLHPTSAFPDVGFDTFENYYLQKYGVQIQDLNQPLLDVDLTSTRLNLLTPRYMNRKGIALPTCSEASKRAKRESLMQKVILVPELCIVHPFSASLWRKAVCLPCILYRINNLLIADHLRITVANEIGLNQIELHDDFKWPPLEFGWKMSVSDQKPRRIKFKVNTNTKSLQHSFNKIKCENNLNHFETQFSDSVIVGNNLDETILNEEIINDLMEIGTWSNDLISTSKDNEAKIIGLPTNLIVLHSNVHDDSLADSCGWPELLHKNKIHCGSPSNFENCDVDSDSEYRISLSDFDEFDADYETENTENDSCGLKIEYHSNNIAEAIDSFHFEQNEDDNMYHWNWRLKSQNLYEIESLLKNSETKKDILLLNNYTYIKNDNSILLNFNSQNLKIKPPSQILNFHSWILADPYISESMKDWKENELKRKQCSTVQSCVDQALLSKSNCNAFSFDAQPNLNNHPGPSPSLLLTALTMSNANDGINLERLETIGDSFLKYAITVYLYCQYPKVHEGRLSYIRSKQVSNLKLYQLGKNKGLGECMIATKFEPHENWIPPSFYIHYENEFPSSVVPDKDLEVINRSSSNSDTPSVLSYNLLKQHSIPDKSIADCVEALIGAYLISCGPRGALLFMSWLGLKVLPNIGETKFGVLAQPLTPLLTCNTTSLSELEQLLSGYDEFETHIGYKFKDRSYLLQAFTHASYEKNRLTDCYQRLEFLGDAVLDYLVTRHLYEDSRQHSPGALTDLRSALVNNTIFASLAVRHEFHKYFKHLSCTLHSVIEKFVRKQIENGHKINDEYCVWEGEEDCDEAEDIEVPKALGDIFESVAGAIYMDSGMSLDAVWNVYFRMMKNEIEKFSTNVPKSPVRELLEMEPETAKFGKPERLFDGGRIRVSVEIIGKGTFKGIGRNYRIAKCAAAKCALKTLKKTVNISKYKV